jgi:predicted DNA-binding transcriptional regulator
VKLVDNTNTPHNRVKDRFIQIEKQLKVFKIKSCLLIYFYLLIYGKSIPSIIKTDLQLSKATLFRNLNFLTASGFILKANVQKSTDKRSTSYYFAAKPFSSLCDLSISEEVKSYAIKQGKQGVLDEWNEIARASPSLFSSVTALLFNLKKKKQDQIIQVKMPQMFDDTEQVNIKEIVAKIPQKKRLLFFTLFDTPRVDVFVKLQQFITSLELNQVECPEDGKKMIKPLSITIDLLEL